MIIFLQSKCIEKAQRATSKASWLIHWDTSVREQRVVGDSINCAHIQQLYTHHWRTLASHFVSGPTMRVNKVVSHSSNHIIIGHRVIHVLSMQWLHWSSGLYSTVACRLPLTNVPLWQLCPLFLTKNVLHKGRLQKAVAVQCKAWSCYVCYRPKLVQLHCYSYRN